MKNWPNKNQDNVIKKIKGLIDEKRMLIRGEKGKFVSLKKLIKKKELPLITPIKAIFFAQEIRKYLIGDQVYFAIDDVLKTATPLLGKEEIEYTEEYEKVRTLITKKVGEVEVADADGILRLIKEVKGVFPGPLSRWLKE